MYTLFSGVNTVRVLNNIDDTDTRMPLSKVQIGDRALVRNDDNNSNNSRKTYDPIYAFGHYDPLILVNKEHLE